MARKSTPQPLTLPDTTTAVDNEDEFVDSPRSPLSPNSPRSPRSPFRFNSSKKSQSNLPPMQVAEPLQSQANIPPSQSLSAIEKFPAGQENQSREWPVRGGFFSNYKASKSSSRLQNSDTVRQVTKEEGMSRDTPTDRPAMAAKVSSKESGRAGTTNPVSSSTSDAHANPQLCEQIQGMIELLPDDPSVDPRDLTSPSTHRPTPLRQPQASEEGSTGRSHSVYCLEASRYATRKALENHLRTVS